jgi:hypothetical protein
MASILLATCLLDGLLNYFSTLKMEAIRSSEMSDATQRTTRRHIPEDNTLQLATLFNKPFSTPTKKAVVAYSEVCTSIKRHENKSENCP